VKGPGLFSDKIWAFHQFTLQTWRTYQFVMELETRLCYRTIRVKLNGNWWSRQGECTTFTADPAWFLKQISKHLIEINNFI